MAQKGMRCAKPIHTMRMWNDIRNECNHVIVYTCEPNLCPVQYIICVKYDRPFSSIASSISFSNMIFHIENEMQWPGQAITFNCNITTKCNAMHAKSGWMMPLEEEMWVWYDLNEFKGAKIVECRPAAVHWMRVFELLISIENASKHGEADGSTGINHWFIKGIVSEMQHLNEECFIYANRIENVNKSRMPFLHSFSSWECWFWSAAICLVWLKHFATHEINKTND